MLLDILVLVLDQIKFEDAERICSMILFEGILGRACYPGRDEERPVRTFTIIAITEGKEDVNKIYIKKKLKIKKILLQCKHNI